MVVCSRRMNGSCVMLSERMAGGARATITAGQMREENTGCFARYARSAARQEYDIYSKIFASRGRITSRRKMPASRPRRLAVPTPAEHVSRLPPGELLRHFAAAGFEMTQSQRCRALHMFVAVVMSRQVMAAAAAIRESYAGDVKAKKTRLTAPRMSELAELNTGRAIMQASVTGVTLLLRPPPCHVAFNAAARQRTGTAPRWCFAERAYTASARR